MDGRSGLWCGGFFVLYAVTDFVLGRLAKRGGERLLRQSRKTGLFDKQEEFASDIFRRVVASWGTLAMVVGGMALGLLLEWRLVALLLGVILLEFLVFVVYWNRFRQPERASERERLAQKRANLLQNLSAINVLIFFGGLVVLLLTDPTMNFIIALVLFILTRQILARATRCLVMRIFSCRIGKKSTLWCIRAATCARNELRPPRISSSYSCRTDARV